MQLTIGIILGIIISILAWRAGSLNRSGAWAAAITGGLIFGLGGVPWGTLLLTFFISSSVLSRAFKSRKTGLSEKFSKGSSRDWGQVLANGGLGTLLVIIASLVDVEQTVNSWAWIAYAGAIAAVNADTWATELGVLNPTPPRLITNGKPVEPGTSGGISLYGTLATLAAAAVIGLAGAAFPLEDNWLVFLGSITLGGLSGSLCDSLLGATIQAIYHCPTCQKETERHPQHSCGTETRQVRGLRWLNNDFVNLFASVMGAVVATGIFQLATII
jgi:uncharacterized protein (TIGR00297 family)